MYESMEGREGDANMRDKYYIVKLKHKRRSLCFYWMLTKVILVSGHGKVRYTKSSNLPKKRNIQIYSILNLTPKHYLVPFPSLRIEWPHIWMNNSFLRVALIRWNFFWIATIQKYLQREKNSVKKKTV